MKINSIIEEANELADRYNLKLVEIDKTDNINTRICSRIDEIFRGKRYFVSYSNLAFNLFLGKGE